MTANRGRYIFDAISREAIRIHRLTGTTKTHDCDLTMDQYLSVKAFMESGDCVDAGLALAGGELFCGEKMPFEVNAWGRRRTPIEGVELRERR